MVERDTPTVLAACRIVRIAILAVSHSEGLGLLQDCSMREEQGKVNTGAAFTGRLETCRRPHQYVMAGGARLGNVFAERLWRSVKYEISIPRLHALPDAR